MPVSLRSGRPPCQSLGLAELRGGFPLSSFHLCIGLCFDLLFLRLEPWTTGSLCFRSYLMRRATPFAQESRHQPSDSYPNRSLRLRNNNLSNLLADFDVGGKLLSGPEIERSKAKSISAVMPDFRPPGYRTAGHPGGSPGRRLGSQLPSNYQRPGQSAGGPGSHDPGVSGHKAQMDPSEYSRGSNPCRYRKSHFGRLLSPEAGF